ncbi:peptidoglycan-binding domain-containing protein [Fibrella aquatilis]|uniref:Peptidoglycan-binding protein n=1 Tax=Fibrella aquatilis TaxID=2817059 RepID=A0A939JXT5_9BACT|nr:hypothetical protein [Fibrella aquatilis]MBO0929648.1 hypothetical protein [Fibrella aquatilis]
MKLQQIIANNLSIHLSDLAFDIQLTGEVQTKLMTLGCLDAPVDGSFGPVSRLALSRFADIAGVAYEERVDAPLAQALLDASDDTFLPLTLGTDFASRVVRYMQLRNHWLAKLPGFLNIIYVEGANDDGQPNADTFNVFNDRRLVLHIQNGTPTLLLNVLATTEPGRFYTENPENSLGAARIAFGQYKSWQVGTHKQGRPGAHEALVQVGNLTVCRDLNRDGKRTGDRIFIDSGFGINQHSGHNQPANNIGKASAGCLVGRTDAQHQEFMQLVKTDPRYSEASHGYRFVSTIIAGDDLKAKVG